LVRAYTSVPIPGVAIMKSTEKKILASFRQLESAEQETLLAFAEFLSQHHVVDDLPVAKPNIIQRPKNESVVAAIKRLSASYHKKEKPELLNKASAIMTKHVMQGHEVELAIDELETLFSQFYENMTRV